MAKQILVPLKRDDQVEAIIPNPTSTIGGHAEKVLPP